MRNAIDIRRFQDDSAMLRKHDAVLVVDANVREESASVYSRSVPCQAVRPNAHCANFRLAGLATFARAEGQAPRANPGNTGTRPWQQANEITTQQQRVTVGKRQGTSFGGTGRMGQGEMPTGASVRLGERRPTCFG